MEEAAKTLAQTAIQDSHIIRQPSPSRDIAPSTSADRAPVSIKRDALPSIQFSSSHAALNRLAQRAQSEEDEDEEDGTASEISEAESSHPSPRHKSRQRPHYPPIPDLRFEQSYLKQLEAAKGSVLWIIIITIREQVLFPGVQGFLWALGLAGIRTLRYNYAENGRFWGESIRDYFAGLFGTEPSVRSRSRR